MERASSSSITLAALALVTATIFVGAFQGCGGGSSCRIGAESCDCTAGGGCDVGLTCLSKRCVRAPSGHGTGGSVGAGSGGISGSGGVQGTGGVAGTGGVQGTGGVPATGGVSGSGGVPATGGASGTGGLAGTDGGVDSAASDGAIKPETGGTGGAPAPKGLGGACKTNLDCGTGTSCLAATDKLVNGVGGPAGGYCTIACKETDPTSLTNCSNAGGICVGIDATGTNDVCMLSCTPGGGANATKCLNRPDVACSPLYDNQGVVVASACLPNCSQNADCPVGRKCDERTNFCVDVPNPGAPFGAHCAFDPTGRTDACAGNCFPANQDAAQNVTASFCTRTCSVGFLNECDWVDQNTPARTGGPHGVCLPITQTYGFGDVGACFQLCDSAADCADQSDPNLVCDKSAVANIGHGVCLWGQATPAGDGGADALRE